MHSLNHTDLVKATEQHKRPRRDLPNHDRPHAPPRPVRGAVARALASVALRVDRESARRAVA